MPTPLRFRVLDAIRRQLLGADVAGLSLAGIRAARGPYIKGGPAIQGLAARITGVPRRDVVRSETTVPGAGGPLPARLHVPPRSHPKRPLVLHLHGGGWVVGGPAQYDWLCGELAAELGAVVVSVDYRKAPEHRAPAAADDARAVCCWLLREGREHLRVPGPLVVAGDSAGGNLSALAAIGARDAGLEGLVAQLLIYPGTDLTMTSASATTLTHEPILHRADLEAFAYTYLGTREVRGHDQSTDATEAADAPAPIAADDPRVSPLFEPSLEGVAPALVQTAEFDPLLDEGRAYADKLAADGVRVQHTMYQRMPHGFVSMPGMTRQAQRAVDELVAFAGAEIDRA